MPDREAGEAGKRIDQTNVDASVGAPPGEDAARPPWYRRVPAFAWALIALLTGMLLGSLFPEALSPIGDGVLSVFRLIATAVPFIIFFTLTPSMLDMLKTGSAAKFAGAVVVAFTVTTVIAGVWALVILVPLFQLELGFGATSGSASGAGGAVDLRALLMSKPFVAIWWSVLVSLFLHHGGRTRALAWFCNPVANVYSAVGRRGIEYIGAGMKKVLPGILFLIGVYIPTGITSALVDAETEITQGGATDAFAGASPVTWYFINAGIMAFLLLAFLAAATLFVAWYTKFPAKRIFKDYMLYVYPFAWATASSAATIPINLDRTEHGLKVRKEVRDFIIPMGATVNLDGTMVGAFVLTVTSGILIGMPPTVLDLMILIVPLTLISVGAPGVPGGIALVAPPIITGVLGIPADLAVAYGAIWYGFSFGLSDQFRTGVNTCDNGLISRMFEHWYPKYFEKGVTLDVTDASGERAVTLEATGEDPVIERER